MQGTCGITTHFITCCQSQSMLVESEFLHWGTATKRGCCLKAPPVAGTIKAELSPADWMRLCLTSSRCSKVFSGLCLFMPLLTTALKECVWSIKRLKIFLGAKLKETITAGQQELLLGFKKWLLEYFCSDLNKVCISHGFSVLIMLSLGRFSVIPFHCCQFNFLPLLVFSSISSTTCSWSVNRSPQRTHSPVSLARLSCHCPVKLPSGYSLS